MSCSRRARCCPTALGTCSCRPNSRDRVPSPINSLASAALIAAGAFAVLNWTAVARRLKPLEYLAKPAVMAALVVVALTIEPTNDNARWAFVAALVLSAAGDVFLMLPKDRFIAGLGSFFAAHVAYIVGLRMIGGPTSALIIGAALGAVFAATVGRRIVLAVRAAEPAFAAPVSAYVAVISLMVATAIATRNALATAGAIVFMSSDTLIAWNRFVHPLPWAPVTIMVTYHLAQTALVLSLLR